MFKQLYQRFSDGTLVAKDLSYQSVVGFQYPIENQNNIIINHNQSTINVLVQTFINNYLSVVDYTIIDENNIQITTSENVSGFVNIIFFG